MWHKYIFQQVYSFNGAGVTHLPKMQKILGSTLSQALQNKLLIIHVKYDSSGVY